MSLTGRAGGALLLAALAVLVWPAGGATLGVALLLVVAGIVADVGLAGSPRAVLLERGGDVAVRLGEPATVTLTVTNAGSRSVRGWVRDAWPPSAGAAPRRQWLDVPPGERRRLETTLRPTRRGDRLAAGVTIRSVGPLGLAARQRTRPAPWAVRVLPPFTSRRHLPEKLARLRDLDGLVVANVRGQGTEFDSLREYVVGDDPRSIDWRATARRGDVVVRTWRPERDRQLLLLLDTGRTSAARVGDAPRLDAALDAALLLAALAQRAGDRVDLLAYDVRARASVEGGHRSDLLAALVQAMAPLEASLVETDARGLVAQVLARLSRRSLVVLFSTLEPAAVEEGLLPALAPLVKRHTVLLAAVADPRVEQLARGRGDAEAVYAAAAAERARADRRRVVGVLRQRGVEVVEAVPEEFASVVADAYLGLKAAGRL